MKFQKSAAIQTSRTPYRISSGPLKISRPLVRDPILEGQAKVGLVLGEMLTLEFRGQEGDSNYNYRLELDEADLRLVLNNLSEKPASMELRKCLLEIISRMMQKAL